MGSTFVLALALLAASIYLIVRPFLQSTRVSQPSEPITHEVITQPETPTVVAAAIAAQLATTDTAVSDSDTTPVDVRQRVEALIAARKAELSAPVCGECQTRALPDDAFCRACGTKLQ